MSECTQAVGTGSIMYKCRVTPAGHAGPCAAPELGRTLVERQAWLAQQPSEVAEPGAQLLVVDATATVTAPTELMVTPQSPPPDAPIGALHLASFADFELSARELMNREEMTPALNNWLTGTAAQIALNHLWREAQGAFDAGCVSITMSREELERFIPERLRPT